MTLTARTTDGQVVLALMFECSADLYAKHPRETLLSPFPDIDVPVFARFGFNKVPHFVHKSAFNESDSQFSCHPFSTEHEIGKLLLGRYAQAHIKEDVQYEVPIGNRIVDVFVGQNDSRIAIEVQLSPITTDTLQQRTQDLWHCGVDVVWVLGGKADNEQNREWCVKNTGSYISLSFTLMEEFVARREIEQIREDFRRVVTGHTRSSR